MPPRKKIKLPPPKYIKELLNTIDELKRPQWGKLAKKSTHLHGLKAQLKPYKKEFSISFTHNFLSPKGRNIGVGNSYKSIHIELKNRKIILENLFIGRQAGTKYRGAVNRLKTKGYSKTSRYYYRLIIPLDKKLDSHFNIARTHFTSDLVYLSSNSTTAVIDGISIDACYVYRDKREHFLFLDSPSKLTFEEFAELSNSVRIGLGYLSGYYAANQGYFFAFSNKARKNPRHFYFTTLRDSIKSSYQPVYSNSYGYLYGKKRSAKKYYPLLRTVSLKEFSLLCQRIHNSLDFKSTLMLILESSIASLIFMPGGYAIALETMADIIIRSKKSKLAPIKDQDISKAIRDEFKTTVKKYSHHIDPDGLVTLDKRINGINQTTNKARLQAPFEILEIKLEEEDLSIIQSRDSFLHGKVPDITKAGPDRSIDRINKDIYYASVRFYTLLSILILKWVGYNNRVVNYPKLYEGYTRIKLNEEPFRQV